ncbi:MAG: hypothetical protein AB7I27_08365 [Bacteriovoracaceae bacterium]
MIQVKNLSKSFSSPQGLKCAVNDVSKFNQQECQSVRKVINDIRSH